MQVISVVNQKGGVGKTTSVINISTSLAILGYKVLVIDFDSQGNLGSGFGVNEFQKRKKSIYNVLLNNEDVKKYILETKIENLYIIPSNIDLAAFELEAANEQNREFFLKKIIGDIEQQSKNDTDFIKFDFIIIDCPPSLSLLTINALSTSNYVLIPLQCEYFALEGLSYLLESAERIKENLNSDLRVMGILLTMYDRRNKLTEQIEQDVRECLGDLVFKTVIPRNVKLTECSSFGIPAIVYDQNCTGSVAYVNFVREMVKKYVRKK